MRLDGPTPRREGGEVIPGWVTYENYGPSARPWIVNVKIKDRIEKFWEGPGEIGTHEDRTEVTVWEGSPAVSGPADDLDALAVNDEKRTYFVVLNVVPSSTEKNIRMSRFTIFDRSEAGYGGKPTHEVTKPLEDKVSISDIPMPKGDYLVASERPAGSRRQNRTVVRRHCRPLTRTRSNFQRLVFRQTAHSSRAFPKQKQKSRSASKYFCRRFRIRTVIRFACLSIS